MRNVGRVSYEERSIPIYAFFFQATMISRWAWELSIRTIWPTSTLTWICPRLSRGHLITRTTPTCLDWGQAGSAVRYETKMLSQCQLNEDFLSNWLLQFWSAYASCGAQYIDAVQQFIEQIDVIKRLAMDYPDDLTFVTTAQGNKWRKISTKKKKYAMFMVYF